jgi:hypothetical protein
MLQTGDLTYILLLAVYGVDSVLTIIHRLILRENIFEAHRKHAYQLMANELKIPHVAVSGLYMFLQALVTGGLILINPSFKWHNAVVVLILLGIVYILFKQKYFILHCN